MEENKVLTTEELKKQEAERKKIDEEAEKKRLVELLPQFEKDIEELCKKHDVMIEPFIVFGDRAIIPELRIKKRIIPQQNPYDVK